MVTKKNSRRHREQAWIMGRMEIPTEDKLKFQYRGLNGVARGAPEGRVPKCKKPDRYRRLLKNEWPGTE